MGQKDLRNHLAVPRRSEPTVSLAQCQEFGGHLPDLPGNFKTRKRKPSYSERSVLGCLMRFYFKTTESFPVLIHFLQILPPTLFGFIKVGEGCSRLCHMCLENAKIIIMIIIGNICQVLHRFQSTSQPLIYRSRERQGQLFHPFDK